MKHTMKRFCFQDRLMNEARDTIFGWAETYLSSACYDDTGIVSVAGQEHFILEYQLFLISNYALMMQHGNDLSQIERIKKFLDNQRPEDEGELLEFQFIEGTPMDFCLSAESLDDIDIADIYGLTNFRIMMIYRWDGSTWTKKNIDSTIRKIREDLEFDGYEPEIEIGSDGYPDYILELAIRIKDENPFASLRMLYLDQDSYEYMLLTLAGSSDPRVRTMIAGMMLNEEIVRLLEKDKDPGVLLGLISNLFAFVHLKDRTIKRILTTLSKTKILCEDERPDPVMIAKRLHQSEFFGEVGKYDEEEMERWRDTWERNTEVMPILEKLKEIIDSYHFSDDQGLELTGWLEERIEELEFILEDKLEED